MSTKYLTFLSWVVGLMAATGSSWLLAQDTVQTAEGNQMEEVYIEGKSIEDTIPTELMQYGNRVEIITSEELKKQGFTEVAQAIQMLVPGLHIRPKNGSFDYFDASIHGSRTSEILWLVDGVRITNRLYNGTTPLDTIPAHMVERIEVLKGGQGIYYGTQSVGGVVNIVTKSFTEDENGAVGMGAHTNGGYNVNAFYRNGFDDHRVVVFASKDNADGYTPYRPEDIQPSATDLERSYDVNVFGLKYAYDINDDSRISASFQRTENELDFLRPYLNAYTANEREEDIITLKFDHAFGESAGLFVKAYFHEWNTQYTRIYNELDADGNLTGGFVTRNDKSNWGYDDFGLNAMVKFNPGQGFEYIVGFDHQNFSAADEVWRIADLEETVNAAFVQFRTTPDLMEDTALALGIRHNKPSNAQESTVWNLTGKHHFSESFYMRGNVGTSFRLPDAEALFLYEFYDADQDGVPDDGWFAIGNPNLEPEESENFNLGVGGNVGKLTYELIAYKRTITNYIDSYVPITIGGVVGESFVNSDDEVNIDGFEIMTSMELDADWSAHFSFSSNSSELNKDGTQLTGVPESESKLRVEYRPMDQNYGVTFAMNHVGDFNARRGQFRGNYTVADLSGYYLLGPNQEHRIGLRIENLNDEVYASRVDRGNLDSTGATYLFDNLGVDRTFHINYNYEF
jgi:vitamin B12 transporter